MTIMREAARQDIPRILELYEELTEEKQNLSAETIERVFAEITSLPDHAFLVAETDGLVTGTLFLQIIPNLSHNARPYIIVENVVVDNRCRRQGIGRLLMEQVILKAHDAGCYKIQLLSHKKRTEAHGLYRSLRFEDSALGFRLYL